MSRKTYLVGLILAAHLQYASAAGPPPGAATDFAIATVPNPAVGVDLPTPAGGDNGGIPTVANSHDAWKPSMTLSTPADFLAATMPGIAIVPIPTAAAIDTASPTVAPTTQQAGDEKGECSLLGPFALLVQLALGGLALMSLVFKRWRERPQRPVKIWFFDVSKQVFGSVLVHVANVFMSMLTSGSFSVALSPAVVASATAPPAAMMMAARTVTSVLAGRQAGGNDDYVPNPCSFYLLNLAIDTTLGIPILIGLLRIFTVLARATPFGQPRESIQSGHYGTPPNAWWWLKQSFLYFLGLLSMKLCVLIIFYALPWISRVGDWALGWTQGDERLQIIFSMMLFPLIMNALQYYIIDSFIKEDNKSEEVVEDDSSETRRGRRYDQLEAEDSEEEEDDRTLHEPEAEPVAAKGGRLKEVNQAEYDPLVDGDGASSSQGTVKGLQRDLIPKE